MILLLEHYIHLLDTGALIVIKTSTTIDLIFDFITIAAIHELRKGANLERLRVRAEDEVVAARAETTRSYRLVVAKLSDLGHVANRRVDDRFNVTDDLQR